jgi:hypothetical protein
LLMYWVYKMVKGAKRTNKNDRGVSYVIVWVVDISSEGLRLSMFRRRFLNSLYSVVRYWAFWDAHFGMTVEGGLLHAAIHEAVFALFCCKVLGILGRSFRDDSGGRFAFSS